LREAEKLGHIGLGKEEVYKALAQRLNKNPVGAPMNETLMKILYILFEEQEAVIGSKFPPGFTTADKLAKAAGIGEAELTRYLNAMADKGLVMDIPRGDNTFYLLSPLVVGFFEYTFMRAQSRLPLKELAELFEQYHHEKGVSEEFFGGDTKMFHTWAYESLMPEDVETEILTYELASEMIRDSGGGSLTMCYCRHQAAHRGVACDAPVDDVCTSLGVASEWLVRRGFARPATVDELLRVLERTEKLGLVHMADNVQKQPAYLCHCCGCCCGVLRAINEHGLISVHPSNFLPEVDEEACSGCGKCASRCHIKAIDLVAAGGDSKKKKASINTDLCIGCGACISDCKKSAIKLARRPELYVPPNTRRSRCCA
jgi:NAD-dependent dihydropyrimidine dehydrogenase PreA subunit